MLLELGLIAHVILWSAVAAIILASLRSRLRASRTYLP